MFARRDAFCRHDSPRGSVSARCPRLRLASVGRRYNVCIATGVRLGMAVVIVLGMLGVLFVALAGASNAALLSALLWQ